MNMAVKMLRYALKGKIEKKWSACGVYDLGAVGKESMIRLLAHQAVDAVEMGVKIGKRLSRE